MGTSAGREYLGVPELSQLFSVEEFELLARERLAPSVYEYIAGWAGTGATARANREAFSRHVLLPRVLVDVTTVTLRSAVLGHPIEIPILFAPTALHRLVHPDGELATARAAARLGTVMCVSTPSSVPLEEVAAAGRELWFQLYWFADQGVTRELIERATAAGYRAIMLTVDAPVPMWREGEMRLPLKVPPGVRAANLPDQPLPHAPFLTWDSLDWLRSVTRLPIVLKGILAAGDARLAAENGAAAVVVSNHGGRALDWAMTTLDALPEVVEAAEGRLEVYLDGGVRRGSDVLKALALGAQAVLLGRPVLWGLGAGGEPGILRMMELIVGELASAMGLCGCRTVKEITPALLRQNPGAVVART